MKKLMASVLALVCVVAMAGCGKSNVGAYPATIMVNGINYYATDNAVPVEVDESVIQYTTLSLIHISVSVGAGYQDAAAGGVGVPEGRTAKDASAAADRPAGAVGRCV